MTRRVGPVIMSVIIPLEWRKEKEKKLDSNILTGDGPEKRREGTRWLN